MIASNEDERAILLIGAAGQLGGEFVKQFQQHNAPLVMTSLRENSPTSSGGAADDDSRWRHLDVSDHDSVLKLIDEVKPRVVINASAYTAVDQAQTDRASAHAINAAAPKILAEACASRDAVLIHFSTDYVFDGRSDRGYVEQDFPQPLNEYGLSKLHGERAVLDVDAGHFVFRTSWLYTPGGRNFVTTMLRLLGGESSVRVVDDQFGCPTWARDLAAVITEWLLKTPNSMLVETAGLYHLCSAGKCSWYEFAAAIRERMLPPAAAELLAIDSATFGAPAARPSCSVLDCSLARETLQLQLPHWRVALEAAMPAFNAAAKAG